MEHYTAASGNGQRAAASTLVQAAALADPPLKVEIDAVAHIGASRR
jgi:enamine deaminase RidA (YjgF/YER057c/UK114 family)